MKSKVIDKLSSKYHTLSIYQVIIKQSKSHIYFWSSISSCLIGYISYLTLLQTNKILLSCLILISTLIIAAILHLITVYRCNKFVKSETRFRSYSSEFKLKWFGYCYKSFINDFRYDQVKSYMGHNNIDSNEKIDNIIAILETEKTNWLQDKWKPVVFIGIMLLPLVGEYIGFRYNIILEQNRTMFEYEIDKYPDEYIISEYYEGTYKDLANQWIGRTQEEGLDLFMSGLAPFLIYLGLTVWAINMTLEKLLLRTSYERNALIKLLRLIRINR